MARAPLALRRASWHSIRVPRRTHFEGRFRSLTGRPSSHVGGSLADPVALGSRRGYEVVTASAALTFKPRFFGAHFANHGALRFERCSVNARLLSAYGTFDLPHGYATFLQLKGCGVNGRDASQASISASVQTRVFGPRWRPGGNPCASIHRFTVTQLLTIPRALRSANLSSFPVIE